MPRHGIVGGTVRITTDTFVEFAASLTCGTLFSVLAFITRILFLVGGLAFAAFRRRPIFKSRKAFFIVVGLDDVWF